MIEQMYAYKDEIVRELRRRFKRDVGWCEDMVSETLLELMGKELGRVTHPRTYFKRCVINHAVNSLRGERHVASNETVHVDAIGSDRLWQNEIIDAVWELTDELGPAQRDTFRLVYFDELSYMDIMEIQNKPYDTVKANYRWALMSLKDDLVKLQKGE